MTLLKIELMLWYFVRCEYHPDVYNKTKAASEALAYLIDHEMLVPTPLNVTPGYSVTAKGRAYVEALKRVKLPTLKQTWVVEMEPEKC